MWNIKIIQKIEYLVKCCQKKNIFAELFTHDHIFAPGYRTPRMIDDKIFLQIINNQLFRLMSCFTNKTKAFREKR